MKRQLSLLGLVLLLAGCGAAMVGPQPPCSSVASSGALGVACTPPQPEVNPVGSWSGTLTTTEGGSGSQAFTAEIAVAPGSSSYTGAFTVGEAVYDVTGTHQTGNLFLFSIPLDEIQPAVTPEEFLGMAWSGMLTETSFSGTWFFKDERGSQSVAGTFLLERP